MDVLEYRWNIIQKSVTKLTNWMEDLPKCQLDSDEFIMNTPFTPFEYNMLCITVDYNMNTHKPPHDYQQQLYNRYKEIFEEYIVSKVLPKIRRKQGNFLLKELIKRWNNHKIMITFTNLIFGHLDRYYTYNKQLPTLREVGLTTFHNRIYLEIKDNVTAIVTTMTSNKHEDKQIDKELLRDVMDIIEEICMSHKYAYETAGDVLLDTSVYYRKNAR